ncbi:S8 family serine peptidase [Pseudobacteroides cellulosolvens]|uniref:Thermitase n=1 Tax=Pseudobacteroides cellulosolvens ATCC 35603 = DSM 2933 TaxID=398512 RepID=A0A0L6JQ88_9FIRM|nr:S8 family serine peptidase [Pseudobacteroides cellulosolvens]KNY27954.1 Thermitase [Pseudobacteroides cellulosolvens ATCC 35603 = DSM 2933]
MNKLFVHANYIESVNNLTFSGALNSDLYRKLTLISEKGKYPFIRVEDTMEVVMSSNSLAQDHIDDSKAMVADHVIVKFKPYESEEELKHLVNQFKGRIRRKLDLSSNTYLVSYTGYSNFNELNRITGLLNKQSIVEYAGQTEGTPNSDINAPEAWNITKGSRDVTVAVIDSGVDYTHVDLKENMWKNPGEVPDNGIDDDANGYVDDVYGWDFANNDSDPMDDNKHGTHCAGIIGAAANNGYGIAGVNWNVSIAALKFLDSDGFVALSDAAQAINYAVKMNIPITSNSWGGGGNAPILEEAFKYASDNGVLSVVSAGNSGRNVDVYPHYPAAYTYPGIISVAATDHNDNPAQFSNYGKSTIDLAAPGVSIYSTIPGNQYAFMNGTSMAAPYVTGAAALIKSYDKSLTGLDIKNLIMSSVDQIDSLMNRTVSGGRLNVYKALNSMVETPIPTPDPETGKLSVMAYNLSTQNLSNNIYTDFLLTNTRDTLVNLSDVKLRYYYTIDGEKEQNFWCDWSSVGNSIIKGTFAKFNTYKNNADYYLEIGFTEDAGVINPGGSIVIKSRFAKADWSNYNQLNDYSFNPNADYFTTWEKINVFINNTLVWGIEP